MNKRPLSLRILPGIYAISRLPPADSQPSWAEGAGFVSLTRSADEYSIVCLQERVPAEVYANRGWCCLELLGPFAFDETGVVAAIVAPLAAAQIGVFVISSFDTDHVLLKLDDLPHAKIALQQAGHSLLE